MDGVVVELTSVGTVAIAIFGAAFSLLQSGKSRVSRSFALLLAAITANNLPEAFTQVLAAGPPQYEAAADLLTWSSAFFLAPLFWLYVYLLTS